MSERVALVTGATGAIGGATAEALARKGLTVIVAGRDPGRTEAAARSIVERTGNGRVSALVFDMTDLGSIRAAVAGFPQDRLDVLVNNAAAYRAERKVTPLGESMMAGNHFGPFALTIGLKDRMAAGSRVLTVTAPATNALDFDDVDGEKKWSALTQFGRTKVANLLFAEELGRRWKADGISSHAIHPGLVRSNLLADMIWPMRAMAWLVSSAPERTGEGIAGLALDRALQDRPTELWHAKNGRTVAYPAAGRDGTPRAASGRRASGAASAPRRGSRPALERRRRSDARADPQRAGDGLGAGVGAELLARVLHVGAHGRGPDAEATRDLRAGEALGHELEDLVLARGEHAGLGGLRLVGEHGHDELVAHRRADEARPAAAHAHLAVVPLAGALAQHRRGAARVADGRVAAVAGADDVAAGATHRNRPEQGLRGPVRVGDDPFRSHQHHRHRHRNLPARPPEDPTSASTATPCAAALRGRFARLSHARRSRRSGRWGASTCLGTVQASCRSRSIDVKSSV
jgi:NAD(P)-dependent dehydrogenase (short-subunit alcohol dehydrogenase family)